jgi:hypothetical protein
MLLFFVVIYVIILVIGNAWLLLKMQKETSSKDITTKAFGEVKFCYNHPPYLNYTCNQSIYEAQTLLCQIGAYDVDEGDFVFDINFISSPYDFNMTPQGEINFTPNASQIGNYTFSVTVWDNSGCENGIDSELHNLTVINFNNPPVLIALLPNQTWEQDSAITPFDLDIYFYDPDGDTISYTNTLLDDVDIYIDPSTHLVTITPMIGVHGTRYATFFAWDPYYANASSNIVTLLITPKEEEQEESPSSSSSGGGGSSAGIPPLCMPRWYCRPWGPCEPNSIRKRECYDLNNCSTTIGKPNLTEPCIFVSTCYDGFKGIDEEEIDCGGPCPPCGSCYDNICNNKEDCTKGLTKKPDCGGSCKQCDYSKNETCYDNLCNNLEDCTKGLTDIPDCGGECDSCPAVEKPKALSIINWGLIVTFILLMTLAAYVVRKAYPALLIFAKKKKRKYYEQRLLLEAKISESIFESILKLEKILYSEDIAKLILLFSTIVRRYFKSLFKLKYEFTYEELIDEIELQNISPTFKSVLKKFFIRSTEMEFSGKNVSREELMAMISELKQIVSLTSEEPLLAEEEIRKKEKASKLEMMFLKISQAESSLRRMDLNDAYFKYLRLVHDYKEFTGDERLKLHDFIARLYDETKLAREKYDYEHGIVKKIVK